jgi:glyoxylase-like metal-dependent hydrolase (beta-lactamase superfamily II)
MEKAVKREVYTLDLNFLGVAGTIAAYLIPHAHGAALVECGPSSTVQNLAAGIERYGISVSEITDVLLTHIHLDHAGSAGWWARQGARIHVHPVGAPHLAEPDRLLASAEQIYGDQMDRLWGEFLPVPQESLVIHDDQELIEVEDLVFKALDTPGHAFHHFAYIFQDVCFSGDIGAVRVGGLRHLRLPMPPPEFYLELWRESLQKLSQAYKEGEFTRIAPTHFGIFDDVDWHLTALRNLLDEVEHWIVNEMQTDPGVDELNERFLKWVEARAQRSGLSEEDIQAFETANPSWMSARGIHRYWHKVRNMV